MFSPTTAILAVLPVYILIIGGAVLRRTRVLKREHDAGIMHVIFSVMLPCFILDRTLGAEVLRNPQVLISGAGLGFLFIIVGISLGYLVGKIIGLKPGIGIRTFALGAGCQNYGFTAVPVVEILWGTSAVALLFVHNIGVEIAIWSVGVMLMSGAMINFADNDGNSSSGFSGTLDPVNLHQEWHDEIHKVWDLFDRFKWWNMTPRQDLVDTGYCLANPGLEYLVYLPQGGIVNMKLLRGNYTVDWWDPTKPDEPVHTTNTEDGVKLQLPLGNREILLHIACKQ